MELLNNLKQYLPVIIIAVILGYFLGLMISTTVDYRLKEAVINLPKPKNNITINLDEYALNKIKSKGEIVEKFDGSKKVEDKPKDKKETKKEIKKENKKNEKQIKKVKENSKNKNDVTEIPAKGYLEQKDYYDDIVEDPNMKVYMQSYNLSKKMMDATVKLNPYKAYNADDSDQMYANLEKKENAIQNKKEISMNSKEIKKGLRPANNIEDIQTFSELNTKYVDYEPLPPREFRKTDFKKQRPWINSTNKVNKL
jgi:hypothetical protein